MLMLLQRERLELQQKIDHIQWRSDMMSKKIKDMSSSTVMMTRVIDSTAEDIAKLE
jgi:diacylglycerol kinase